MICVLKAPPAAAPTPALPPPSLPPLPRLCFPTAEGTGYEDCQEQCIRNGECSAWMFGFNPEFGCERDAAGALTPYNATDGSGCPNKPFDGLNGWGCGSGGCLLFKGYYRYIEYDAGGRSVPGAAHHMRVCLGALSKHSAGCWRPPCAGWALHTRACVRAVHSSHHPQQPPTTCKAVARTPAAAAPFSLQPDCLPTCWPVPLRTHWCGVLHGLPDAP